MICITIFPYSFNSCIWATVCKTTKHWKGFTERLIVYLKLKFTTMLFIAPKIFDNVTIINILHCKTVNMHRVK